MTEQITEKKTPEQLGAEIRMYVDAGRRISLLCGIEIGRRLVQAKELLEHGEWLPWLEKETEFSDRSAARYMKLFEEYGASQQGLFGAETNSPTLSNLPISKALALLSVPESDRIDFAEEVDAEHISVRELEEKIREREKQLADAEKAKEFAEKAKADAETMVKEQDGWLAEAQSKIAELTKKNRELESRPVEVAVETVRDEEAIKEAEEKARKKAEAEAKKVSAEYEKTVNDLNAKLLKAEKERDSLKAKADSAGSEADAKIAEANREAERIRAELEEAKKQLKTSDADVAKFGVWFGQVQSDFMKMMEALQKINEKNPETGEKLKTGAVTLLNSLLERMGP